MTFPVVATSNSSNQAATGTSVTVDLPASISSGDLLIMIFGCRPVTVTTPTGWTRIGTGSGAVDTELEIYWREADGGEGATETVTISTAVGSAHRTYRITGAEDPDTQPPEAAFSFNDVNNNSPDPPSLTPTGGAEDFLWIATYIQRDNDSATGFPTSYTGTGSESDTTNFVTTGWAQRDLNASSENPSNFTTTDAEEWSSATIAIHPAGGAPATNPKGPFTHPLFGPFKGPIS